MFTARRMARSRWRSPPGTTGCSHAPVAPRASAPPRSCAEKMTPRLAAAHDRVERARVGDAASSARLEQVIGFEQDVIRGERDRARASGSTRAICSRAVRENALRPRRAFGGGVVRHARVVDEEDAPELEEAAKVTAISFGVSGVSAESPDHQRNGPSTSVRDRRPARSASAFPTGPARRSCVARAPTTSACRPTCTRGAGRPPREQRTRVEGADVAKCPRGPWKQRDEEHDGVAANGRKRRGSSRHHVRNLSIQGTRRRILRIVRHSPAFPGRRESACGSCLGGESGRRWWRFRR